MTIDIKIRDMNLQNNINRQGSKISALSSGKLDKYECLTCQVLLSSGPKKIIQKTKFT